MCTVVPAGAAVAASSFELALVAHAAAAGKGNDRAGASEPKNGKEMFACRSGICVVAHVLFCNRT